MEELAGFSESLPSNVDESLETPEYLEKISGTFFRSVNSKDKNIMLTARTLRTKFIPSNLPSPSPSILNEKQVSIKVVESCKVCFSKDSDSVIMPCGHGGLCFDCAHSLW